MRVEDATWPSRIVYGDRVGERAPPPWLRSVYAQFARTVASDGYPCFFGQQALNAGDLYVSLVEGGETGHLPRTLQRFIEACARRPRRRNNLAVFFEPGEEPPTHEEYQALCWRTLRELQERDPGPQPEQPALAPSHPMWEFAFGGHLFFVVGLSPSYQRRRSRNVGPAIAMLFQPRDVFETAEGEAIGDAARQYVRDRLRQWDDVGVHPDLGTYGDPDNREWKQYFLPDDQSPLVGVCPLSHRAAREAAAPAHAQPQETRMNEARPLSAATPRPRQQIIHELEQKTAALIAESPFFQSWVTGRVSRPKAQRFLVMFDHLVASFPPLIAIGASRLNERARVALVKNLFEECGEGDCARTHHAIYRNFLRSAGLSSGDRAADPHTVTWRDRLWSHALEAEPAASIGAIAAGEFLAQPALSRIYRVIEPLFPDTDVEYFTTHLELEVEHVNEIADLIELECRTDGAWRHLSDGFDHGLWCWRGWFSSAASVLALGEPMDAQDVSRVARGRGDGPTDAA